MRTQFSNGWVGLLAMLPMRHAGRGAENSGATQRCRARGSESRRGRDERLSPETDYHGYKRGTRAVQAHAGERFALDGTGAGWVELQHVPCIHPLKSMQLNPDPW